MVGQKWICMFMLLSLVVQESDAGTQAKFEKYDLNRDGVVTYDEAEKMLREPPFSFPFHKLFSRWLFTEVDELHENGDGWLSKEEFTQLYATAIDVKKERLEKYGSEGDGYITYDEAEDIMQRAPFELIGPVFQRLFEKFDKDSDRRLNKTEFALFYAEATASKKELNKFRKYDKNHDGYIRLNEAKEVMQRPPFILPYQRAFFLKFDDDLDKKLDIEEFTPFYAVAVDLLDQIVKAFKLLDSDNDGKLSESEAVEFDFERDDFNDEDAQRMFLQFDKNAHSGYLDTKELAKMLLWARQYDPNSPLNNIRSPEK